MLSTQPACPVGSINSTHSIQHKFHHKQHRIGVVSAHAHATSELLQDAAPAASTIGPSLAARTAAYNTIQPASLALDPSVPLPVLGKLPTWLRGSYVRNGPGDFSNVRHFFDGLALLLKLDIDGAAGTVHCHQRMLESEAYRAQKRDGQLRWREFATPPRPPSVSAIAANVADMVTVLTDMGQAVTDNAAVNIVEDGHGQLLALTESVAGTYHVSLHDLTTLERHQYDKGDGVTGMLATAHPKRLCNGQLVNVNTAIGIGYQLYQQDPTTLTRTPITTIPFRRPLAPAWVHDFAVTDNGYAVIIQCPLYFNLLSILTGKDTEHCFMDWCPEDGVRFDVVDLQSRQIVASHTTTHAWWSFHYVNLQYDAGKHALLLDASVYDNPDIVNELYLDRVRAHPGQDHAESTLRRFEIPLGGGGKGVDGRGVSLVGDAAGCSYYDFPVIHPGHHGKAYRYAYGTTSVRPTNVANGLVKIDIQQETTCVWHEPGVITGEPAFVPKPGSQQEDEGVVLAVNIDAQGDSFLLCLDAVGFEEVARVLLQRQLPAGFHGGFIIASEYTK